jgi:uridine kinase
MFQRSPIGKIVSLSSLINEWHLSSRSREPTIIGVDGPAGAGKSSLCVALVSIDPSITIVPMDDFFLPPGLRRAPASEVGRQIDWRRVLDQVVIPLTRQGAGHYQRFDWQSYTLKEWHDVPAGGIVLLDGVYSTREELAPFLAQRMWIHVPGDFGLERGIERDGEVSRAWWMADWVEDEDRYILAHRPEDLADIVINGANGQEHYLRGQYDRLR